MYPFRVLRAICVVLPVLVLGLHAQVRIVGSDLLGAPFEKAIQDFSNSDGIDLSVALKGTRPGLEKLVAGKADIALASMGPDETLPGKDFVAMPVAYHVAVVVVPLTVDIAQMSADQLAGAYASQSSIVVARWADLGARGGDAQRLITPRLFDDHKTLAPILFRNIALKASPLKANVVISDDWSVLMSTIKEGANSLCVLPAAPPASFNCKTVLVAAKTGDVAFGPSADNVNNGDYPLRVPVMMVFPRARAKELMPVLHFLLSEDAANALQAGRVMPLPIGARNQEVFDIEAL